MSTSYLDSSADSLLNLYQQSFTIAGWFMPDEAGPTFTQETWMISPYALLQLNTDGTVTFKINNNDGGVGASATSTVAVSSSEFNFVVCVYSIVTHTISVYLNNEVVTVPIVNSLVAGFTAYADSFRVGNTDRTDDGFSADEVTVYSRDLSSAEAAFLWNNGGALISASQFSVYNLVFQASLINTPARPLVLGAGVRLATADRFFDGDTNTFRIATTDLFAGNQLSSGFNWVADNFFDKVVFAQHDNTAQYWQPPLPNLARDLPGLPTGDSEWDGVLVFANHVLLWRDDRLKWSDVNDFSLWLPVDQTVVSGVFTTNADFQQPAPGGTVTLSINNPVTQVVSISLSGSLDFGNVAIGDTAQAILTITNSGTAPLSVTGITFPEGYSGIYSGTIPVNQSAPVVVTFAPTAAVSYDGTISVASNATTGTHVLPVTGTGTGSIASIALSGVLDFGAVVKSRSVASSLLIKNTGTADLHITGISLPSGFAGTFAGTIAAGDTQIVTVTFSPLAKITYGGLIHVSSDAASGSSSINCSGSGIGVNHGIFVTDNGSLQFGSVAVGSTPTGTLRIYNTGSEGWSVVGLSLPAGYSGTFTGGIAAGSFHDVTVTFTPIAGEFYSGAVTVALNKTLNAASGAPTVQVSGTGTVSGKVISLSGALDFGSAFIGSFVQSILKISNTGTVDLTVSSITYPSGFSGAFAGVIAPGSFRNVIVTFAPTSAIDYSGTVTVNSDKTAGTATFSASGTGSEIPATQTLQAGQFVSIPDTQNGLDYFNYYTVVSMTNTTIVLQRLDLTGETPNGTIISSGHQVFSVDANESGETRVVGSINGPIFKILSQGDFAYIFKERGILSIQYTGFGNGVFFVHPEVTGEGLIGRNSGTNLNDGRMVFLGHKELYIYNGGPQITPVAQQVTRQLFKELDRSRLDEILLFNNEDFSELWVVYPITVGKFRVMIWNYVEDTTTFDDYDPAVQFTAAGLVDWTADPSWSQFADSITWNDLENTEWQDLVAASNDHLAVLGSKDGGLRIWGTVFNREGSGYHSESQTIDFDLGDGDSWKYVDVIKLTLQIVQKEDVDRLLWIQVGGRPDLGEDTSDIVWTTPQSILVNGKQPVPVKINPGGAGRYLRIKFYSDDAEVQWRISSFEILARVGNTY